jgi:hypothetical protein
MHLKTLASAATLLLTLAPLSLASAQASYPAYVFETVDSIDSDFRNMVKLTGIIQGESAPRTIQFYNSSSPTILAEITRACERFALIAMSKPGQYYLEARGGSTDGLVGCKLTHR